MNGPHLNHAFSFGNFKYSFGNQNIHITLERRVLIYHLDYSLQLSDIFILQKAEMEEMTEEDLKRLRAEVSVCFIFVVPTDKKPRKTFEITPLCAPKYSIVPGVGGFPDFFWIGIPIFMLLRSPCKNFKPYDNPFWCFNNGIKITRTRTRTRKD